MTEEEWLGSADIETMLVPLRRTGRDKRLNLFAAMCFRHLIHLLPDSGQHNAVEVLEKKSVGRARTQEEAFAVRSARSAIPAMLERDGSPADDPYLIALMLYRELNSRLQGHHAAMAAKGLADNAAEEAWQRWLLRDLFGNPFRPVVADPDWFTPTVQFIASSIYQERAFDRLPILADALEEAGCVNADVLMHCRQPGEHVRGCWVVDLILGKE